MTGCHDDPPVDWTAGSCKAKEAGRLRQREEMMGVNRNESVRVELERRKLAV
jgi:hypothetical protein